MRRRSTSTTAGPRMESSRAACRPAKPPPTTATSARTEPEREGRSGARSRVVAYQLAGYSVSAMQLTLAEKTIHLGAELFRPGLFLSRNPVVYLIQLKWPSLRTCDPIRDRSPCRI